MVFASNIQLFYEQFILSYISALQKETGKKSLVLAGGGFANVKLNRRIFESRIFESMYVVPAMGDDGAALGAAFMP
jgi:carbamoyltransferase